MHDFGKRFKESMQELKNTRVLATAAMLLAIAVVLGFFAIQVTESIKISLAFVVDELTGMMFGPFVGMIVGMLADIVKYMIRPTGPFFPGFTISEALTGLIYGFMLYRRKLSLPRVIAANSIVTVVVNMLLNTYWLTLLYGSVYTVILPARIIKELIMLPINIAIFYLIAVLLQKAKVIRTAGKAA